jgi:hypothetical protein
MEVQSRRGWKRKLRQCSPSYISASCHWYLIGSDEQAQIETVIIMHMALATNVYKLCCEPWNGPPTRIEGAPVGIVIGTGML